VTGNFKKITQDTFLINTLLLALLVMALALQALIVVAWIYSFIPIKPSPFLATLFSRHQVLVFPKRDMAFYHFFIAAAIFLQAAGLFILRAHLNSRTFIRQLLAFTLAEYGWTCLMVFAVFKMFVYGFAPWTKGLLYISFGLGVLSKIFWKEIGDVCSRARGYWEKHRGNIKIIRGLDIAFAVLIGLILYVPDTQGLLAKMFMTDHFHHFDTMIMGQAWAQLKGAVLDIDQYTHYAVGLPVVIGHLAQGLGGFSYTSVIILLGIGMVVYYIGVYALVRFWLKSVALAMAMVILLIKWQMFHPGVSVLIFDYPSASVWRYPLDIFFLFLLLAHLRYRDWRLLAGAGFICGFSSFYMIDTGVYMSIAFAFYILFELVLDWQGGSWQERSTKVLRAAGMLLIIPLTACGFLWITQGPYLFTKIFWENLSERTAFFLMGHGNLPIYKSLIEGKYLESWMGFFIPWVYTLVLIVTSTLLIFKKISREYLFLATVTIYGIGLYHYYACRSADTSYYVVVLPFVFILGYVVNGLAGQGHPWRQPLLGVVLALAFFALATNHYFLNYPNVLNLSRNPMTHPVISMKADDGRSFFNHNDVMWPEPIKLSANSLGETDEKLKTEKDFDDDRQLKDFYSREFDFSRDADLIARLTGKEQQVPLISSFETKILMQADRRPFFYYFPFVDSRPMHIRMFDMTALWTTGRLQKTMQQLEEAKPPYIFMEKVLLAQSVPAYYEYLYPDLLVILNYIHQNYTPDAQGYYLIAMKRKTTL
jgi:hypothetical protein